MLNIILKEMPAMDRTHDMLRSAHILGVLLFALFPLSSFALYPEQIGATQYATGHLSSASKLKGDAYEIGAALGWRTEKTAAMFRTIEEMLISGLGDIPRMMRGLKFTESERRTFLELTTRLQDKVSTKKPLLIMIGENRAVATDGHHKIRALAKLNEILKESQSIWPLETRSVLTVLGRVSSDGRLETALKFKHPKIVDKIPKDAKASKVVRTLLKNKMGLWKSQKDDELARSFYSKKKSQKISKKDLKYLGAKLGIEDGPQGLKLRSIQDLPDSPNRTLMGHYFESRGLKAGDVAFRTYVEFYVGNDVKEIASKNANRFPNLIKFLTSQTPVKEQKLILERAMNELDEMFVLKKKISKSTMESATKNSKDVEKAIGRIQEATCLRAYYQLFSAFP